jgi:hypothetical protein
MKELTIKEMARLGGLARAKKLSKMALSKIGQNAINIRWAKYRAEKQKEK